MTCQSAFEMARDTLRRVALSAGATWSIQNGAGHIVDERKPVPGNTAFVLNSQTGMIGRPAQTEDGIAVRSLINPALSIHSKGQINQSSIQRADPEYGSLTSDVSQRNRNLALTGTISSILLSGSGTPEAPSGTTPRPLSRLARHQTLRSPRLCRPGRWGRASYRRHLCQSRSAAGAVASP